jgi:hypothetical protein
MGSVDHLFVFQLRTACPPSDRFTPECAAFQRTEAALSAFPIGDPDLDERTIRLIVTRPRTEV